MAKICGALLGRECVQEFSDPSPCGFDGSFLGVSDERFEFGEHHLDGVEVGAVGRQEKQMGADLADGLAGGLSFVASQVVENDHVTGFQGRRQGLLDPGGEGRPVDGAVEHEGSDDPVMAQARQKGQGFPMTVRNLGEQGFSTRAPTTQTRHVGLDPGLVDKDQAGGIKPVLMGFPAAAKPCHPRPILLPSAFFGSSTFQVDLMMRSMGAAMR